MWKDEKLRGFEYGCHLHCLEAKGSIACGCFRLSVPPHKFYMILGFNGLDSCLCIVGSGQGSKAKSGMFFMVCSCYFSADFQKPAAASDHLSHNAKLPATQFRFRAIRKVPQNEASIHIASAPQKPREARRGADASGQHVAMLTPLSHSCPTI